MNRPPKFALPLAAAIGIIIGGALVASALFRSHHADQLQNDALRATVADLKAEIAELKRQDDLPERIAAAHVAAEEQKERRDFAADQESKEREFQIELSAAVSGHLDRIDSILQRGDLQPFDYAMAIGIWDTASDQAKILRPFLKDRHDPRLTALREKLLPHLEAARKSVDAANAELRAAGIKGSQTRLRL